MAGPIVDLVLLRGLLADTALRPGTTLAAKVLDRDGQRGTLLLNGARVAAQLPPGLAAGDVLRVRVQDVSAERLTLQVLPPPEASAPAAALSAPTVGLPLPGGARFRVEEQEGGAAAEGGDPSRRSIALRFDSPRLGRLDFLIDLDAQAATATIGVAAGAADLIRSGTNDLRRGLAEATGRPASVRVEPRAESLDVRG